ncbi:MAG: BREX system Lon protease-like protein BrxL [Spirochaetia bacterium]|jgi:ATP-dependent Lon protease|nr:BREX system Lon protease-like protein BrxL [Spirochaetia bacterium]
MTLEDKINQHFAGLVVRKDLSKLVKGNALVPTYVLEYLLGQYCATSDEASIKSGIETVKNILHEHYVNRNEAELVKSRIKESGRHKIIDRITAGLNDTNGNYEASFSNLGIKKVVIDSEYIKQHPKLLVGGVWCILDMEYHHEDNPTHNPWFIDTLKPIQISHADLDSFSAARMEFTTPEWIDLIIQSLGFNPDELGERNKMFQLVRLISFCENNYNLIELGPKGTGKSHVFSEFSPHGILVSGSEVSLAKLFVNNSNGRLGLVGYWDVVAFDEFAGKGKNVDKTLVDVMKNYMANKSFSRGTEQMTADASMVFVGNTSKSVSYMLKHNHLFIDLPDKYQDSAFLDRLHFYIPGWEVNIIRNEMFTESYGFIVDYLAQILKMLRFQDYSDMYRSYFQLDNSLSTRDKDSINKTVSGLLKIIYPHRQAGKDEIENLLSFAVEGRKRIKSEIQKIDSTFDDVFFRYKDTSDGRVREVETNEEKRYPIFYHKIPAESSGGIDGDDKGRTENKGIAGTVSVHKKDLKSGEHFIVMENQTFISYYKLFADYLRGAKKIEITDPYIRISYQIRNLMEFIQVILMIKEEGEEISVHLVTDSGDVSRDEIKQNLKQLQENLMNTDISFTYEFAEKHSIHARSIVTDTGWKISLDRGLDIFQRYDHSLYSIEAVSQEARFCKPFEITYLKI